MRPRQRRQQPCSTRLTAKKSAAMEAGAKEAMSPLHCWLAEKRKSAYRRKRGRQPPVSIAAATRKRQQRTAKNGGGSARRAAGDEVRRFGHRHTGEDEGRKATPFPQSVISSGEESLSGESSTERGNLKEGTAEADSPEAATS